MKVSLIKKRYFVLIFIFLVVIAFVVVNDAKNRAVEEHLKRETNLTYLDYKVIYNKNKSIADLVFKTQINQPHVIELFKNRQREKLYKYFNRNYKELRKFSIRQLQFHLPNNDSFLRMHRPLKFGDNLTKVRLTVKYVNEHKKYIDGFEGGKVVNGFRFVYPMFDENKHVGSVEVSFSALSFITDIIKHYKIKSNFLMDKNVVDEKAFKIEEANYLKSPFPQYYFQKHIVDYLKLDPIKIELSKAKIDMIQKNIKIGSPFPIYDKVLNDVIIFIPIKNAIS